MGYNVTKELRKFLPQKNSQNYFTDIITFNVRSFEESDQIKKNVVTEHKSRSELRLTRYYFNSNKYSENQEVYYDSRLRVYAI